MMPIIRPLPSQCVPPTEYEKEQAQFAEMQAVLRRRKRWPQCWRAALRDALRRQTGPRPVRPGAGTAPASP